MAAALRLVGVLGVIAVVLLLQALPANAHASFVTSQPAPGTDLAAAPGVVVLDFSEPMIEDLSQVTVTDPTGQQFTARPSDDLKISVDVDSTMQGVYEVDWKTVSPIDGHTLEGGFEFGVGADAATVEDELDGLDGADLVIAGARAVEYAGLLGALGLLALAGVAGATGAPWRPRGLQWWVVAAGVGGIATVLGEVLLAGGSSSVLATARSFLAARSGVPRALRIVLELGAVVSVWISARRTPGGSVPDRWARVAATILTLASLVALSAASHAAASGSLGVIVNTVHLWTAGLWAGAILAMALHRPPDGWTGQQGRALLGEYWLIALSAFIVTVLTGSVRGLQELSSFSDLWSTSYGQTLTRKLAAVAAMVPLSVLAWWRHRVHARLEGGVALLVVISAATLAAYPVPPGRAGDEVAAEETATVASLPQEGDLTLARAAGDTVVGLSIRPGEPGINDVYVHLVPPRGSDEAGDLDVALAPPGAPNAPMETCDTACRVATLPLDGGEQLDIEVSGPDGGSARFQVPSLPAPDGTELAAALTERMREVDRLRYDEVFGPVTPPITSSWEIVAPNRIHGVSQQEGEYYNEIIRIEDRWWQRDGPDAVWEARSGPAVKSNRFIWDYDGKTAARVVGEEVVDGTETQIVSFVVDRGDFPIWYRLWVDADDRVRRAEMRTQGHFMDHRYHDFDGEFTIEPPSGPVRDREEPEQ